MTKQQSPRCRLTGAAPEPASLKFTRMLADATIENPVQIATDTFDRPYIISKKGRVYAAPNGISEASTVELWLDWAHKVDSRPNEAGLLAIAFEPRFSLNGQFYVHYNRRLNGQLQSVISRLTVRDLPDGRPDPDSEEILMVVDQPYGNHNGGQLAFGMDGYLYIAFGDGGSAGDPLGHSQNLSTLLGAILRIDINSQEGELSYRIPESNPFVDVAGARGEIYAYGLRNPWRFSFDYVTKTLWAGDVGQNLWEEINIVEKGGNYGWNTMEGHDCYEPAEDCNRSGLKPPLIALPRNEARSITGGFVYRGDTNPSLYGTYVYGDYVTRRIWGLVPDGMGGYINKYLAQAPGGMSAFAEDRDLNLYLLDYENGHVYRIDAQTPEESAEGEGWPTRLSETGCFEDLESREFIADLTPYEVNVPLWSDGSTKERAFLLPEGTKLGYKPTGVWDLPTGAVAVKTFVLDGKPVETRLLVKKD